MSDYKKKADPHIINKTYASVLNNYLHLRGAGRRIIAITPRGKNITTMIIRWGDDILQREVHVAPEKIARYIIDKQPTIQQLEAILNQKWDKLNQQNK